MQAIGQGDVILVPVQQVDGQKIHHLILAAGEVTGHKHRIFEGKVELSQKDGTLYLRIFSPTVLLVHEEGKLGNLSRGIFRTNLIVELHNQLKK